MVMKQLIANLKDKISGKVPSGRKRSSKWPAARKQHLGKFPACAVCGSIEKVEVHHKKPFHLHPELELDPNNFISLCESKNNGINCHLFIGHLGSYKSLNNNVEEDAKAWNKKLSNRP